MTDEERQWEAELDSPTYQRARPLTPEQLRRAYQQPALSQFFEKLAKTRLAMLQKKEEGEGESSDREMHEC